MRVVSLNGAAFIFLQRGERLKENEGLTHNKFPDRRYVLWPRGDGWDVRVKLYHLGKVNWEPVGESLFSNEDAAWQAAFEHLENHDVIWQGAESTGASFRLFSNHVMAAK